jgi:hypothetical protein
LHKKGRYYIVHFKELFALDGKASDFYNNQEDIARRNTIANLLEQWNLLVLVDGTKSSEPVSDLSKIKILPFKEKVSGSSSVNTPSASALRVDKKNRLARKKLLTKM